MVCLVTYLFGKIGGEVLFLPSKSVDISRLINMQNSQVYESII
jgi:hypothetical protein